MNAKPHTERAKRLNVAASVEESDKLVDRIRPILGGVEPGIVGATLSQCVAIWVASHVITNTDKTAVDEEETANLRKDIFDTWLTATRELIPVVEAEEILPRLFGGRDH